MDRGAFANGVTRSYEQFAEPEMRINITMCGTDPFKQKLLSGADGIYQDMAVAVMGAENMSRILQNRQDKLIVLFVFCLVAFVYFIFHGEGKYNDQKLYMARFGEPPAGVRIEAEVWNFRETQCRFLITGETNALLYIVGRLNLKPVETRDPKVAWPVNVRGIFGSEINNAVDSNYNHVMFYSAYAGGEMFTAALLGTNLYIHCGRN